MDGEGKALGPALAEGGIRPSRGRFGDAIVVCTKSPVELGWQAYGIGSFWPKLGLTLWGTDPQAVRPADLEVMVVLSLKTLQV